MRRNAALLVEPHDADVEVRHEICEIGRPLAQQSVEHLAALVLNRKQIQDEQRDDDREHGVGEAFSAHSVGVQHGFNRVRHGRCCELLFFGTHITCDARAAWSSRCWSPSSSRSTSRLSSLSVFVFMLFLSSLCRCQRETWDDEHG
jgi:hypothetical protein